MAFLLILNTLFNADFTILFNKKGSKMKHLLFLIPFLFVMGCTTPYNYLSIQNGDIKTVGVGGTVIRFESGFTDNMTKKISQAIRRELVYTGLENNILTIEFREYYIKDGYIYAKDAFTKRLRYDLGRSKIVKYEDMTMEVLNTDNNEVTFKVLDKG